MRAIRATSRSVECLKFQHVMAVKSDFICGSVEMQAYVNYQFCGCKSSGNLVCAFLLQEKKSYETLIKQDILVVLWVFLAYAPIVLLQT